MTHVTVRNGLTLAYTVALVNAALAVAMSFGVHITNAQQAALVTFVNVAVLLAARVLNLPERTATGTVQVQHTPVLVETPTAPPVPTVTPVAGPSVATIAATPGSSQANPPPPIPPVAG